MDMFLLVDLRFIDAPIRYHWKVEDLSSSLAEMESVFTLSLNAFKSRSILLHVLDSRLALCDLTGQDCLARVFENFVGFAV